MAPTLMQEQQRAAPLYTLQHSTMRQKQWTCCFPMELMQQQQTTRARLLYTRLRVKMAESSQHMTLRFYSKETVAKQSTVVSHDKFKQFEPLILDYTQTVGALIAHSADVSAQDNQGLTHLHCAARDNNLEMIRTLLSCQVDIDARTPRGRTALQLAVHGRYETVARTLIDAGADVNAQDNEGLTGPKPMVTHTSIEKVQDLVT